jgi:hypothetical protein
MYYVPVYLAIGYILLCGPERSGDNPFRRLVALGTQVISGDGRRRCVHSQRLRQPWRYIRSKAQDLLRMAVTPLTATWGLLLALHPSTVPVPRTEPAPLSVSGIHASQ